MSFTLWKSNLITARDTTASMIERGLQGVERVAVVKFTSTGAMADNDVIVLAELPVNAKITSIRMWSTDHGATGLLNVGFHRADVDVSTLTDTVNVLDEDAIATVIDINTAATNDVEIRYETLNINTIAKKAWELAGVATQPAYGTILLTATLAAVTTVAGDLNFIVRYTE